MGSKRISLNVLNNREDECILVYYILLGIVTILITRPNVVVGIMPRIIYLMAIVIPTYKSIKWLPFAVTVFYSISMCSFSPLLPSKIYIVILMFFIPAAIERKIGPRRGMTLFFILLYFFIIDLLHFDFQVFVLTSIILAYVSANCIKKEEDLGLLALSFVFVSVVLSVLFLINYETFLQQFGGRYDDMERSGWINPNIFGGHLSIGIIMSFVLLFDSKNRIAKIGLVASIIVSMIALILNASRGSFIASIIPAVILILFSDMKSKYKALLLIIGLLLFLYVATSGYFDLLLYRFMNEDTASSGGSRFIIWENKLSVFFRNPTIDELLFGMGQTKCALIGSVGRTHNDFVTSLVAYGLIGFVLFVTILVLPLYKTKGKKKPFAETTAFYLLLIIECFILEPLFRGYFIYFMLYLFIAKFLEQTNIKFRI